VNCISYIRYQQLEAFVLSDMSTGEQGVIFC
jgi:hypothetical protein